MKPFRLHKLTLSNKHKQYHYNLSEKRKYSITGRTTTDLQSAGETVSGEREGQPVSIIYSISDETVLHHHILILNGFLKFNFSIS